ncbi:hypothetical protein [Flavobacterium hungaricum]|uniref:AraC family transcriptional regulator n=1 Tax=Flavobacterium hungaricum TaxID=2082725 RepID=A0ABR9TG48_9FLAO|nr:hypothetical protein [Flavobacterium hungaricum]MBE8724266.1 hypothetical protein [Flavobacterium hungaricum]
MKKLYLNNGGFEAVFDNLKESFGGDLKISSNEYNLRIESKWAKGTITGIRFEKEMTYLNFDIVFYQDVMLSIEANPFAPVFFAYCEKGTLTHSFGANGELKTLKKQQSGIMSNSTSINSVLYFESHKQIQFSLIGIPTAAARSTAFDFASEVKKRFIHESGNYLYIGSENHKIGEKFEELKTIPKQGTIRYLLMKDILKEVLELEIAQHSYNYLNSFDPLVNFAVKQIGEIKRISNLNFSGIIAPVLHFKKNLQTRSLKEKYHLELEPFNQKLAS